MKKIYYDFSGFMDIFDKMRERRVTSSDLLNLKKELNKFFKDAECMEVMYTNNTDKMFFGMKVIAIIRAEDIYDYLVDDEPKTISKYIIEIDSKLFDPVLDLTTRELIAVMLHEVGHVAGSSKPVEMARQELDAYLAANKDHIRVSDFIHYKEILAYGLKDYLSKCNSMFYNASISEINADEFANAYGYDLDLSNAYSKIVFNNSKLYSDSQLSKFVVFAWTLNLYKNLKVMRVPALRVLNRAKLLTGSRLERKEMDNVIRKIKMVDDDILIESESLSNTISIKVKEKLRKARLNNLRTIDSTYYELAMQVKNVEDENDALYLMRQINNSIAVLEEYQNSKDCDEWEFNRWSQTLDKFKELRDKLSSTIVYKNKNYGLFVNYPDIAEDRY